MPVETTITSVKSPKVMISANRLRGYVPGDQIQDIISHRLRNQREEYLVRWKSTTSASYGVYSWHDVSLLVGDLNGYYTAIHHVQRYLDRPRVPLTQPQTILISSPAPKRKIGLDFEQPTTKRVSPAPALQDVSRASPAISINSSSTGSSSYADSVALEDRFVYNCRLGVEAGRITCSPITTGNIDTSDFPTLPMQIRASTTRSLDAANRIRDAYRRKLQVAYPSPSPLITICNTHDQTTPSLEYEFINKYVYGKGVVRPDPASVIGCGQIKQPGNPQICRPEMGGHCGCEYTKVCECLEFAQMARQEDQERLERGELATTMGLPKKFPYSKETRLLVHHYIMSSWPIYECNDNCACGDICKSRVVQRKRQVPLEIFRTPPSSGRGWGLRAKENLRRGQFIDVYLGEVITDATVQQRLQEAGKAKPSYLFDLDCHREELAMAGIGADQLYTVDGEHTGNATRFINHSCDPNCGVYTVQFDKNNNFIYSLAFFATEDIPKDTELTFDYVNSNGNQEEDEIDEDSIPCRCGAKNCRKWLWR